ncbi:MAG TPA: O-antigen ligase family protein, partial [Caldilineaceae bacterium]|nr:O-antigen ligase family protein [Caldilineaceae bacterium]
RPVALNRLALILLRPVARQPVQLGVALLAVLLLAVAVGLRLWWLAWGGLGLLGYVSLARPSLWAAVLLFSLPFYFSQSLPILPTRATNFIDLGLLGGLVVTGLHRWLLAPPVSQRVLPALIRRWSTVWGWALAALVVWALAAAAAAEYTALALREWRTVFLAGGLLALLLRGALADGRPGDRRLLVMAWLAGATVVAAVGLWHFAAGVMLIEAEGVQRIRVFYGSPNNLALYLERTLPVALAFVLLLPSGRDRWLALAAALVQGAALLLTFSKGSLLLGLPAGLATLWLGGWVVLRARGHSRRPLWWITGAAGAGLLLLLPFLGTERFQRLLDFSQGTGFFRLLLWRSAWQMALDHPLWGVGPDNFLYVFRSEYLLPAAWQEPNLNHPHNWPLDWWTRLGLPGLLLGIAFFGAGCRLLWLRLRSVLRGDTAGVALWLGLLASALAALIHGLIDLSYAAPDLMLVWVFTFSLATIPDAPGSRRDEVTETGYSL